MIPPLVCRREGNLGKGSSGHVFRGVDRAGGGRKFALKIVPITLKASDVDNVLSELRDLYSSRFQISKDPPKSPHLMESSTLSTAQSSGFAFFG